jgi:hypothetical protein
MWLSLGLDLQRYPRAYVALIHLTIRRRSYIIGILRRHCWTLEELETLLETQIQS